MVSRACSCVSMCAIRTSEVLRVRIELRCVCMRGRILVACAICSYETQTHTRCTRDDDVHIYIPNDHGLFCVRHSPLRITMARSTRRTRRVVCISLSRTFLHLFDIACSHSLKHAFTHSTAHTYSFIFTHTQRALEIR